MTVLVGGLYRSRFSASHFEFESTRHGSKVMPVQAPFILQATPEEFQSPPYDGIEPHLPREKRLALIEKVRVRVVGITRKMVPIAGRARSFLLLSEK